MVHDTNVRASKMTTLNDVIHGPLDKATVRREDQLVADKRVFNDRDGIEGRDSVYPL
jgi:hypothetical protein